MPLYEFICAGCGYRTEERLFQSLAEAEHEHPACPYCPTTMELALTRFTFNSFTPFVTEAFNERPGLTPVEVSDRSQLRKLLRSRRMVEMGDSSNYFGSSPKSVPSWEEVSKQKNTYGGDPNLAKLVHVGTQDDMKKLDLAADQTDFGRKQSSTRQEFIVGKNS